MALCHLAAFFQSFKRAEMLVDDEIIEELILEPQIDTRNDKEKQSEQHHSPIEEERSEITPHQTILRKKRLERIFFAIMEVQIHPDETEFENETGHESGKTDQRAEQAFLSDALLKQVEKNGNAESDTENHPQKQEMGFELLPPGPDRLTDTKGLHNAYIEKINLSISEAGKNLTISILSEIRESNPCPNLGKVMYYHYTNLAIFKSIQEVYPPLAGSRTTTILYPLKIFFNRAIVTYLTLHCPARQKEQRSFSNRSSPGTLGRYLISCFLILMRRFLTKGWLIAISVVIIIAGSGAYLFFYAKEHKAEFAAGSFDLFQKVSRLLPLAPDTKKEIEVVNALVETLTKQDEVTRVFLVLLQNSDELRPGGGFLGQYAVIKVKNGEIVSTFVEDANLLDQRLKAAQIKITPPYPFLRKLQLKRWGFRDSNFSPNFPTNAEKAEYFYRLAGGREKFDGVIAVNSLTFNRILAVTGPIQIPGDSNVYTSEDGAQKLEERVEKAYLGEDVPAELKQNRKLIMKKLAAEIIRRAVTVSNIPKLAEFAQTELRNKDVMLYFKDPALQSLVESVHWDGSVTQDWGGDYLMLVDANMGALKTDYYIKRTLDYTVDFTGEKPIATAIYTYQNNAPRGDWRTSDYHTYLRAFVPLGSTLLERKWINAVITNTDFDKTYFGGFVDVEIGQSDVMTTLRYQLPDTVTPENYRLLIQKQSGVGTIPVTVHLKTNDREYTESADLLKDLNFSIQTVEEKR